MQDKKQSLVPELRFPGFEGEWEVKKLGDILDYEQPTPYLVSSDSYQKDGTPVLTAGKTFILGYTDETFGIYNKVPVIIFDDFVTESKYVTFPFKAKSSAMKMLSLKDNSDNLYFAYISMLLNQKPIGDHKRHWISETSQIFVTVPPTKAEQQKIAECLSSVDNLIQAEADQLQALKDHKKGLMQQLFPQEGETTPKLRFPGFEGKWEEKKLGDVFKRITRKNKENNKNVLTISAQYGLVSQIDFFNKSVAAADVTGYYLLEKGDFAYNKSSSSGNPVGVIKPLKMYDKGVVSTLYICFRCNNPASISFWEQYFNAGCLDAEIRTIAQEGARSHGLLNVPTSDFFTLTIIAPSLPEQQKIAECLSSLDEGIAAQQRKVEALKEHKKGLMQKLFPTIN